MLFIKCWFFLFIFARVLNAAAITVYRSITWRPMTCTPWNISFTIFVPTDLYRMCAKHGRSEWKTWLVSVQRTQTFPDLFSANVWLWKNQLSWQHNHVVILKYTCLGGSYTYVNTYNIIISELQQDAYLWIWSFLL